MYTLYYSKVARVSLLSLGIGIGDENMEGNLNTSKFKKFFKSKNTVTAICAILVVVVLVVGYTWRVNSATKPVNIPVAKVTIQPKTEITSDMITVIKVPQEALKGNYYSNTNSIVGKFSNVNTVIPAGSLFYKEAVTTKDDLPDAALFDVKEGETLFYLTVNMLTSYTNSILPGNYIDIYISTKENGKALVGKLLKDVKILAVKTSDGKNVFENSDEARVPYVIIFALPEEQHLLLRKINAINNYSVYSGESGFSRIEIIPVPRAYNPNDSNTELTPNVTSQYLEDYILNMASTIPEDVPEIDIGGNTEEDTE